MEWWRNPARKDQSESYALMEKEHLILIMRAKDHDNAWVIFGRRPDRSPFEIVSHHELIADVKRQAEDLLTAAETADVGK